MNKKKVEIFLAIVDVLILLLLIFIGYKEYTKSSLYFENRYKKEPTTSNLLELCNYYSENNDMKYLQYIDTLLSAEDYEEVIEQKYGRKTYVLLQKDIQIMNTMYICAANNDINSFVDAMESFYLQLEPADRPYYFHKIMKYSETSFLKENKNIIITTLYNTIQKESPLIKLRELLNIKAYYTVIDDDNPQLQVVSDEIENICNELNYGENIKKSINKISEKYEQYWLELIV